MFHNKKSLIGKKFSRLTIVRRDEKNKYKFICLCDCGAMRVHHPHSLLTGKVKSCGCFKREMIVRRNTTHGKRYTAEWSVWNGMKDRCSNPRNSFYKDYGGRGIKVCNRWKKFENFYADMRQRPSPKHSIERKNVNGNYRPSNCIWVLPSEQASNRRNSVKIKFSGQTKTLTEWARILNMDVKTLWLRIFESQWSIKKAITTPLQKNYMKVTYRGQSKTLAEWSKIVKISSAALRYRVCSKWPTEKAFSRPSQRRTN